MEFRPLTGMRVVDVTSSLAGPYCTEMLAALGADVIKVEPPSGRRGARRGPPFFHGDSVMFFSVNAGKRSLALDLKRGLDVLLAARRAGRRLPPEPAAGHRRAPGSAPTTARPQRGSSTARSARSAYRPLHERPGYDPLNQAVGGIMSVTGEPAGRACASASP